MSWVMGWLGGPEFSLVSREKIITIQEWVVFRVGGGGGGMTDRNDFSAMIQQRLLQQSLIF